MNSAITCSYINTLKKFMASEKAVILDTETTGLPFHDETVSVVNVSVIDLEGNVLADFLVKPPVSIPPEVSAIHGITDEMVKDCLTWEQLAGTLHDVLKDRVIGAWNAPFDKLMVEREMKRLGHPADYLWVDLMKPYAMANSKGRCYKLEKAARDEGITDVQTHLSLGDCQMTLAVLKNFIERKTSRKAQKPKAPDFPDLELIAKKAGF